MKIHNLSKAIVGIVLCSSLLTACDNSGTVLSLIRLEQSGLKPTPAVQQQPSKNTSMWASMSQSFGLNDQTTQAAVMAQIANLQKHQAALYKTLQKAGPYISYVFEQTKKRGLPTELALLPVVESGFDPHAKSPAGASGLWQIMPGTASDLGLKNNAAYDGRRDIVASTNAALKYLTGLGRNFQGNWELALAAYNWGPGNIRKVVRQQSNNFWNLTKLPAETAQYVPKLLALAAVIKDPARYNIKLPPMDSSPQVASIQVGASVDLKKIAQSTNIDLETMRQLNPGYRNMATAAGTPNTLLVPVDKAHAFKPMVTPAVLAVNTDHAAYAPAEASKPAAADTVIAVDKPDTSSSMMMKAILTQGRWLLVAIADIPSSNKAV